MANELYDAPNYFGALRRMLAGAPPTPGITDAPNYLQDVRQGLFGEAPKPQPFNWGMRAPAGAQPMGQEPRAFQADIGRLPRTSLDASFRPELPSLGAPAFEQPLPPSQRPPQLSPGGKSLERLPYETLPQEATREAKGGRLDLQQEEQRGGSLRDLITPEMRSVLVEMTRRDPSLMKDPHRMGLIITKMMPFMHKMQQEKYAQLKQEHADRMESRRDERADAAHRLETYKVWLDQVRDKRNEAKDAWSRLKDVQDPTKDFAGDRKALVKRYTDEYETAETDRKRLEGLNPYQEKKTEAAPAGRQGAESAYGKGTQPAPGALATLDEKAHSELSGQYQKGLAKAQDALKNAKSLDERNLILRNILQWTDQARVEAGMPPMTDEQKTEFVASQPSHDIRTYGEKAEDWLGQKAREYFPTAYQFYKDMQSFAPSGTDDPLAPSTLLSYINPLEAESQFEHGLRKARGMEPTAAELSRGETSSYPERALGALQALGGVAGPAATVANPLATGMIGGAGRFAEQETGSPWAGLAAMLAAGGGAAGLERLGRGGAPSAMPPQGPPQLGGPGAQPRIPYFPPDVAGGMSRGAPPFDPLRGMMGGGATPAGSNAPPPSGVMGAPAGAPVGGSPVGQMPPAGVPKGMPPGAFPQPGAMNPTQFPAPPYGAAPAAPGAPQLPPPGPAGPARGPMPGATTGMGPTVRPKAGLYGQPPVQGEQRPIEMGPPGAEWRMPPPREPLRLPPPTEPRTPAARAEAAAEIASGREPTPAVEKPSRLQRDVTQFGDFTVGDEVKFNKRIRKIEELIPAAPGHMAAKAKLSGLKSPVSVTSLEPAAGKPVSSVSEGQTVSWTPGSADMMRAMGMPVEAQTGRVEQLVKLKSGDVARIRKPDGSLAEVRVRDLERPKK